MIELEELAITIIITFGLVILAVMSFIYFVIITFFPYSIYPNDGQCLAEDESHVPD